MEQCDVCRLALNSDDGYPYILPLNFGMEVTDDTITLYFHGATEGKKYELIAHDNRVSFEMDCAHRLVTDLAHGHCTMEYQSIMGRGHIERVAEEDKYHALCVLMAHYHQETFPFNQAAMPRTTVLKLTVESMTGKARMTKPTA